MIGNCSPDSQNEQIINTYFNDKITELNLLIYVGVKFVKIWVLP